MKAIHNELVPIVKSVKEWRNRAALPALLLLLALSSVFLFGNDRGHFYRPGHHDWVSSEHLAVAVNLSPAHRFLMFHRRTLDRDGAPSYAPYNRFPLGGYVLIRLATLPFSHDLSAQIYAARIMMLLFFSAAGVLAYLSLCRLTSSRWMSLAATLLAFSSYYCLYYNDMTHPETAPDLCGVLLTFHGMLLFVQEGRFRQLLGKTGIALLLGWHVYALLLPFIVFGLARELSCALVSPPPPAETTSPAVSGRLVAPQPLSDAGPRRLAVRDGSSEFQLRQ